MNEWKNLQFKREPLKQKDVIWNERERTNKIQWEIF